MKNMNGSINFYSLVFHFGLNFMLFIEFFFLNKIRCDGISFAGPSE